MGIEDLKRREKRHDYIQDRETRQEIEHEKTLAIPPSERYEKRTFSRTFYETDVEKNESTKKVVLLFSATHYTSRSYGEPYEVKLYRCKNFIGKSYILEELFKEGQHRDKVRHDYRTTNFANGVIDIIELRLSANNGLPTLYSEFGDNCPLTAPEIDGFNKIIDRYRNVL